MTRNTETTPMPPQAQRDALADSERRANAKQPRNFRDDALTDKQVEIAPDGTGPSSTGTMDAPVDREQGSGKPD